jgi:hypothetical protein
MTPTKASTKDPIDPLVDEQVEVQQRVDQAKAVVAEVRAQQRRLQEIVNPPTKTIETEREITVWGVYQGRFGPLLPARHVEIRTERAEPSARERLRAELELPEVRLRLLVAEDQLELAEVRLREVRHEVWLRKIPAADAQVRRALEEIANLLDRAATLMHTFADETIPALNARLGRDPEAPPNAPPRYHLPSLIFPALIAADARSGSLLDHWTTTLRRDGWLP